MCERIGIIVTEFSELDNFASNIVKFAKENNCRYISLLFIIDVSSLSKFTLYTKAGEQIEGELHNIGNLLLDKLEEFIKSKDEWLIIEKTILTNSIHDNLLNYINVKHVDVLFIHKEKMDIINNIFKEKIPFAQLKNHVKIITIS